MSNDLEATPLFSQKEGTVREAQYRYKTCAVCQCPGSQLIDRGIDSAFDLCFPNCATMKKTNLLICADCARLVERKRKRMEKT